MAIPELMWQADLHGPANFVVEGLGEIANSDPEMGEPSDQPGWFSPRWLEEMFTETCDVALFL